jgi:hypothetical protein
MPTAQTNNDTGSFAVVLGAMEGSPYSTEDESGGHTGGHQPSFLEGLLRPAYCTNCTGMVFDSVCVDCGHDRNEDHLLFSRPASSEPQPPPSNSGRGCASGAAGGGGGARRATRRPVIIWDDQMAAHDEGSPQGSPHPERWAAQAGRAAAGPTRRSAAPGPRGPAPPRVHRPRPRSAGRRRRCSCAARRRGLSGPCPAAGLTAPGQSWRAWPAPAWRVGTPPALLSLLLPPQPAC